MRSVILLPTLRVVCVVFMVCPFRVCGVWLVGAESVQLFNTLVDLTDSDGRIGTPNTYAPANVH